MITLRADNRKLLQGAKYSFLVDNYGWGVQTFGVTNVADFVANDFILLGNFGSENTEILQINSIDPNLHTLTVFSFLKLPHSESTKVTIIPYDKVRFFHTPINRHEAHELHRDDRDNHPDNPEYSDVVPLTGYVDIQAKDWFTDYSDEGNSTGFGWFVFYNSFTTLASQPSNPIPYAGFDLNTVKKLFDSVLSLLNNKELKLVSQDDLYMWANEGYERIRQELALVNHEWGAHVKNVIKIVPGVQEYLLPLDFGDLIDIVNAKKHKMGFVDLTNMLEREQHRFDYPRYYIRGHYIGFKPVPHVHTHVTFNYVSRPPRIDSYDDVIDLPDGGFYTLKDFILWRAYLKTQNPNAQGYYKIYTDEINSMKFYSIKRDANLDSWEILPSANV